MKRAEHLTLRITPLTPIHVGAGVDLDPTGYVVRNELLFRFDPVRLPLTPADRRALVTAVDQRGDAAVLAVQRFFHERREACAGIASQVIAVAPGVAQRYAQRVGQVAMRDTDGRNRVNRLEIERTTHHPHTGEPYLPGSSIKGAMRTAWLDRLNGGRPRERDEKSSAGEKRLLMGSFHTDPFRLLSVGDAHGGGVASQVLFSTNHKKRQVFSPDGRELTGQGPSAMRECVAGAQHEALGCTLEISSLDGLHDEQHTPRPGARIAGWQALAAACNAYYRPRMARELALLSERRLASEVWLAGMQALLGDIAPALDAGDAMLLRVGRHSGAESVTLDGWRNIRVMKGRGQAEWSSEGATTVWLAARNDGERSDMQPFGWLLVHPEAQPLEALGRWCAQQPLPDLEGARRQLAQARERAEEEARRLAAAQAVRLARQAAEQLEAAEKAARLATLSEAGRRVEALRALFEQHTAARKQPVGGQLYGELRKLVSEAEQGAWASVDATALADLMDTLAPARIELGGKARELKAAAVRLRSRG